jgi:hypothetical protein
MTEAPETPQSPRAGLRRSPMGAGSVALSVVAWSLVTLAFPLSVPHELSSVAFMVALSGAAVAREGRRVEEGVSPRLLGAGLFLNLAAIAGAVVSIGVEIMRRRAG